MTFTYRLREINNCNVTKRITFWWTLLSRSKQRWIH